MFSQLKVASTIAASLASALSIGGLSDDPCSDEHIAEIQENPQKYLTDHLDDFKNGNVPDCQTEVYDQFKDGEDENKYSLFVWGKLIPVVERLIYLESVLNFLWFLSENV